MNLNFTAAGDMFKQIGAKKMVKPAHGIHHNLQK